MARRGENIYKRKDGRWEGRYIKERNPQGKAVYGFVYARSYHEVRQKVEDKKKTVSEEKTKMDESVFKNIAEQWFSYISISTRKSTAVKYRNLLDKHILPEFGEYSVSKIQTVMIEQFTSHQLQEGRLDGRGGLSPKTVNDILSILREIFLYAENRNVPVTCQIKEIHIRQTDKKLKVISKEDQEKLEKYLLNNPTRRNTGILISLYMGLRIGELCALKWKNILLDQGIIQIRNTIQRVQNYSEDAKTKTGVIITSPKSECAIRDIPIPAFLSKLIEQYYSDNEEAFFLTGDDNNYLEPRTFQYYFKKILKTIDIEPTNFHTLRHTFATRCIEMGFDMKSLSEILGHSTVNMTLNRYVHSSMEMKRKNMLRISRPLCQK